MIFPLLRITIGSILLASGFSKVIYPYQNFLYAVQAYQLLPGWAETLTAVVMPWIELFTGLFVVLGLWTPRALRWSLMLFAVFIIAVGQALMRGLPLERCGCFGSWVHAKPEQVIVFDSACFLIIFVLLNNLPKALRFSIDSKFFPSPRGRG